MTNFTINENSLSMAICNAQNKLEVFDGDSYYIVPLKLKLPKSKYHFLAKTIDTGIDVVLNYRNIKKIIIDYTPLNCIHL